MTKTKQKTNRFHILLTELLEKGPLDDIGRMRLMNERLLDRGIKEDDKRTGMVQIGKERFDMFSMMCRLFDESLSGYYIEKLNNDYSKTIDEDTYIELIDDVIDRNLKLGKYENTK